MLSAFVNPLPNTTFLHGSRSGLSHQLRAVGIDGPHHQGGAWRHGQWFVSKLGDRFMEMWKKNMGKYMEISSKHMGTYMKIPVVKFCCIELWTMELLSV